jgi:hypothetical protein
MSRGFPISANWGCAEQLCGFEPWVRVRVMMLNTTFINISVISWWSVLLVEVTDYPEKTTATYCK